MRMMGGSHPTFRLLATFGSIISISISADEQMAGQLDRKYPDVGQLMTIWRRVSDAKKKSAWLNTGKECKQNSTANGNRDAWRHTLRKISRDASDVWQSDARRICLRKVVDCCSVGRGSARRDQATCGAKWGWVFLAERSGNSSARWWCRLWNNARSVSPHIFYTSRMVVVFQILSGTVRIF